MYITYIVLSCGRRKSALKSQDAVKRGSMRLKTRSLPRRTGRLLVLSVRCQHVYLFSIYETRNKAETSKARSCAWPSISYYFDSAVSIRIWIYFLFLNRNVSLQAMLILEVLKDYILLAPFL